jgi:hypothetical protein
MTRVKLDMIKRNQALTERLLVAVAVIIGLINIIRVTQIWQQIKYNKKIEHSKDRVITEEVQTPDLILLITYRDAVAGCADKIKILDSILGFFTVIVGVFSIIRYHYTVKRINLESLNDACLQGIQNY